MNLNAENTDAMVNWEKVLFFFKRRAPELKQRIENRLNESAFENRASFHPGMHGGFATEELNAFLKFLYEHDRDDAKYRGRKCRKTGLGIGPLLALESLLMNFAMEQLANADPSLIKDAIASVNLYFSACVRGYMEESEVQIGRDQEQLRRALSAALERQSRELLIKDHAINTSLNPIMITDLDGVARYVNRSFLTMWEIPYADEVLGKSSGAFWKSEQSSGTLREVVEAHGGGWREEFIALRKEGSLFEYEIIASLIEDTKGVPTGIMVSFIDITERKQSERELRKLEWSLYQSQKMEAIGNLASGIAHDFNNILQAISGYIQLISVKGRPDESTKNYLTEVDFAVERASDLVQRLLTFSRKVKPELKALDLNLEVLRSVKMLERAIPKMIRIEMRLGGDLAAINGDPNQIEQILMNLGVNARDAMPDGGTLLIETKNVILDESFLQNHMELEPGSYALLSVSDTGIGMDESTSKHIFEPFFTTKEVGEGTGLGLSTVYGIVKGHGGHITCKSVPNVGTTFNIYFPAALAHESEKETETEPLNKIVGGSETILLVDDEKAILEIASDFLKDHGYNTIGVDSGERALALYRSKGRNIDLIILDLNMPGMGGHSCLKKILEIDPEVKVIVSSGFSITGRVKEDIDRYTKGVIRKPYRLEEMLSKIRTALDENTSIATT